LFRSGCIARYDRRTKSVRIVPVLDDALEVRAHGRESFEFSGGCVHQDPGLFPNLKIFPELTGTSLSFAATTEFSADSTI
jgi:hypothetical protein